LPRCMEQNQRIKINAMDDGYVYSDQFAFFLNRPEEEKSEDALKSYAFAWCFYNAVDEVYQEDDTCELVWDPELEEAYFVFDNNGLAADTLRERNLL
jgi:hypothetical protein